jgi:hypothetical protein
MTGNTIRPGSTDRALLAAEQEIASLRQKSHDLRAAGDGGDHDEIWDRVSALEAYIAKTAPDTLIGAAVKLRRLADPDIGLEAGDNANDPESVRQILATVERSIATRTAA